MCWRNIILGWSLVLLRNKNQAIDHTTFLTALHKIFLIKTNSLGKKVNTILKFKVWNRFSFFKEPYLKYRSVFCMIWEVIFCSIDVQLKKSHSNRKMAFCVVFLLKISSNGRWSANSYGMTLFFSRKYVSPPLALHCLFPNRYFFMNVNHNIPKILKPCNLPNFDDFKR